MSYVKVWERYNNKKLPENMEIHHIDGNHENNDPENLKAVTIEEHLIIHLSQKDFGAAKAILMRMNNSEEQNALIRECSSKLQKKLWEEGRHNFQKFSKEKRCEISKYAGNYTKENKLGIHRINSDPILSKENSRKAGLVAAKIKAGFLDTKSEKHGSKFVKGTKWWVDIKGNRIRSVSCPGKGYIRGMKYES